MDIRTVSDSELNRILSLKSVHDKILKAMQAQRYAREGYRQPAEVLRNQCDKCHYYAVECLRGSEYDPEDVFNRNCARFSFYDLDAEDGALE